jgi:uncharacterized delta-60 repeat protein
LLQSNGKFVLVGETFTLASGTDFAATRVNGNGTLDSTFGNNGRVITDFFDNTSFASCAALQPDGKILAAGTVFRSDVDIDFGLARYNGDGPSFDVCLQDDGNGNLLQFNSTTGDYIFSNCRKGLTLVGTGAVSTRFCKIEFRDRRADRALSASINSCTRSGAASMQVFSQGRTFTITDEDTTNNTCACR